MSHPSHIELFSYLQFVYVIMYTYRVAFNVCTLPMTLCVCIDILYLVAMAYLRCWRRGLLHFTCFQSISMKNVKSIHLCISKEEKTSIYCGIILKCHVDCYVDTFCLSSRSILSKATYTKSKNHISV